MVIANGILTLMQYSIQFTTTAAVAAGAPATTATVAAMNASLSDNQGSLDKIG